FSSFFFLSHLLLLLFLFLLPHSSSLFSFAIPFPPPLPAPNTMTQQPQDLISPYSESLCQTFNEQYPDSILAMARSFTKQDVISASVVGVRQEGFKIDGRNSLGRDFEVSVAFLEPVTSVKTVKDAFLHVCKKVTSEKGTPVINRRRQVTHMLPP
ncbi:hypothetical protein EDD21DRAFT_3435, partial [Dissophora ornata]